MSSKEAGPKCLETHLQYTGYCKCDLDFGEKAGNLFAVSSGHLIKLMHSFNTHLHYCSINCLSDVTTSVYSSQLPLAYTDTVFCTSDNTKIVSKLTSFEDLTEHAIDQTMHV